MKILVFGAGAIGMAYGGFLSRRHDVTLLGRPRHCRAIRKKGLRVGGIWGRHVFRAMNLCSDSKALVRAKAPYDLILLTVKAYDTAPAARVIRRLIGPGTAVVSLQNGLGNIEALHRVIPAARVVAGRVIFGVEVCGPGSIRVTVIAAPTALGETAPRSGSARIGRIARAMNRAGLRTVVTADVRALLWAKVIYNCALNPLASLLGCHYGYLAGRNLTRKLMDAVIREIYAVARRCGIRLKPRSAEDYRKLFYGKLVPSTYHHHPSMLQDLRRGKRTEIESLNGAIARLGRKHGVPVPVNRWLAKMIRAKERSCRTAS